MRLGDLIRPDHPVVRRLLAATGDGEHVSVHTRAQRLCGELAEWEHLIRLGPAADFADAERVRAGNCVDFATLLCSCLRAAGVADSYAVMGSPAGHFPTGMHAWLLARDPDRSAWLWVDPADLRPVWCDPRAMARRFTVVAVWNDATAHLTPAERDRFWDRAALAVEGSAR